MCWYQKKHDKNMITKANFTWAELFWYRTKWAMYIYKYRVGRSVFVRNCGSSWCLSFPDMHGSILETKWEAKAPKNSSFAPPSATFEARKGILGGAKFDVRSACLLACLLPRSLARLLARSLPAHRYWRLDLELPPVIGIRCLRTRALSGFPSLLSGHEREL